MPMKNLFAENPRVTDSKMLALSPDPAMWEQEIVMKAMERFPKIKDLETTLTFTAKNDALGTAVGSVVIKHPQNGAVLFLPVIIKDFKMYPFDVWQDSEQKAHPVIPDLVERYFFNPAMFSGTGEQLAPYHQFMDQTMWEKTTPPLYGKYVQASDKSASLLEMLDGTIYPEHLEDLRNTLDKHKEVLVGYSQNETMPILKKAYNLKPIIKKKAVINKVAAAVIVPVKRGRSAKVISTFADELRPHLKEVAISYDKFPGDPMAIKKDNMHDDIITEYKLYSALPPTSVSPHIEGWTQSSIVDIKKAGAYELRDIMGSIHAGYIPDVLVDFNMKKKNDKIFIGKRVFGVQAAFAGAPMEDTIHDMLKPGKLAMGRTGVFITSVGDKVLSTMPFTVKRIIEPREGVMGHCMDNGEDEHLPWGSRVVVEDMMGNEITLLFENNFRTQDADQKIMDTENDGYGRLNQIVKLKDGYVIPRRMKFVELGYPTDFLQRKDEIDKYASFKVETLDPLVIKRLDNDVFSGEHTVGVFSMHGKEAEDANLAFRPMDEAAVQLALLWKGMSVDMIKGAMDKLEKEREVKIHGGRELFKKEKKDKDVKDDKNSKHEKSESKKEEKEDHEKEASAVRCNLVREASFIAKYAEKSDPKQVVDTILGLNFINPQNIEMFMSYIPALQETADMLAEYVLASRLGLTEIPEEASAMAMKKIHEVIDSVSALQISEVGRESITDKQNTGANTQAPKGAK